MWHVLRWSEGMIDPMTEVELASHVASYAILALLSDAEVVDAWREHWRGFEAWSDAGLWFDRHREMMAELDTRRRRTICGLA